MSDVIHQMNVENAQKKNIPDFRAGDTIIVNFLVTESNNRTRVQAFEGVVIGRRNRGFNSSATIRKTSSGVPVERVFPLYSPQVESIQVKKRGKVRQARINYITQLSGRKARIAERIVKKKTKATNVNASAAKEKTSSAKVTVNKKEAPETKE